MHTRAHALSQAYRPRASSINLSSRRCRSVVSSGTDGAATVRERRDSTAWKRGRSNSRCCGESADSRAAKTCDRQLGSPVLIIFRAREQFPRGRKGLNQCQAGAAAGLALIIQGGFEKGIRADPTDIGRQHFGAAAG